MLAFTVQSDCGVVVDSTQPDSNVEFCTSLEDVVKKLRAELAHAETVAEDAFAGSWILGYVQGLRWAVDNLTGKEARSHFSDFE